MKIITVGINERKDHVMWKILIIIMVFSIIPSVFAEVYINCAEGDIGWFLINYDATNETELVSGFGLDIIATDANFVAVEYIAGSTYNIYPGSIVIEDNVVIEDGNAIAPADARDALGGLGTSGVTLEMAALYDHDDANQAPPASGTLVKLQVDGFTDISIFPNIRRDSVVLEDGTTADAIYYSCTNWWVPPCWKFPCFPYGDYNGDSFLTFNPDVQILIDNWDGYDAFADHNKDGYITFSGDVQPLIDHWVSGCP